MIISSNRGLGIDKSRRSDGSYFRPSISLFDRYVIKTSVPRSIALGMSIPTSNLLKNAALLRFYLKYGRDEGYDFLA